MNRFKVEVCLGVSIDNQEMVQVAVLDANELESPWPLELRRLPNLEGFEEYWLDHLEHEYSVSHISVEHEGVDLGVLHWLAEKNLALEEFRIPPHMFYFHIQQHKVPSQFQDAYALALGCVLRGRATSFTKMIIEEAFRLETGLRKLTTQLECLRTILPPERCPF